MMQRTCSKELAFVATVMAGGCAAADTYYGDLTEQETVEEEEKSIQVENGLEAINGLTSVNGLISRNGLIGLNGLTATNGLTTINGLSTMNGLTTVRGATTIGGRHVDCQGRSSAWCTGSPDGLLSRTTGLMKTDLGVTTAGYLIRCALPADKSISIKDYHGELVTLPGQVGLAPGWQTGSCSTACEEKVTACMLAFLNQMGKHRKITMTAGWPNNPLGTDHRNFDFVESALFGNIFISPPQAYVVSGYDHARTVTDVEAGELTSAGTLQLRSCEYAGRSANTIDEFLASMSGCSAINLGTFVDRDDSWKALRGDRTKYNKCSYADSGHLGIPSRTTALACSGPGTSTRTWKYPITSWRTHNPWLGIMYNPNCPDGCPPRQ